MPSHVLVLDTAPPVLGPLVDALREVGGSDLAVEHRHGGAFDLHQLAACDLLVFDAEAGDGHAGGLDLLASIRARDTRVPIVVTAEAGTVAVAHALVEAGANDILVRGSQLPERTATLLAKMRPLLRTVLENRSLRLDVQRRFAIVGESPPVLAMVARIAKVAPIPRPVLVLGERGTGKELVAKALHDASGRSGPFVAVNCACFTDELLEAELFGHERGAFTGAHKPSLGKFELANQGTLFLDEIGHMSLPFQRKILRAVEYGTFLRVGGQAERSVSVRVVAATNADLRARMGDGTFLPDLYDRLAFEVIHVPPLRERPGDIDVLARHFFERFMSEVPAFHGKVLTEDGLEALRHYAFPGNVRELRTVIERAVYRDTTHALTAEDIGELGPPRSTTAGSFRQRVEELERALIHEAMTAAHGNGAEAARALGLAYHQLRYYLRKYPLA